MKVGIELRVGLQIDVWKQKTEHACKNRQPTFVLMEKLSPYQIVGGETIKVLSPILYERLVFNYNYWI